MGVREEGGAGGQGEKTCGQGQSRRREARVMGEIQGAEGEQGWQRGGERR